jgi:C-terminal processing protease CtpA/Prc
LRRIGGWTFGSNLVNLLGLKSPYEVISWDADKRQEIKTTVEGIELPKLQDAARKAYPGDQPPKESARLSYFDDGKIALMKVNGFGGFVDSEGKKDLKVFFKESFEDFAAKHTRTLILDVRDNGGG